ncbi:hypothetical protein [Streptomyces sp. cg36]|uniref:hypothetical protein n=1 Tax=Streptomyces sp. cg36 TaxID=3238798 RepID=UPI0034E1D2DD
MRCVRNFRRRLRGAGPAGLLALALLAPGLLTAAPAAADQGCAGNLTARLDCWAGRVGVHDASVVVTLREPLKLDGNAASWKLSQRRAAFERGPLVVMVPSGHATGAGGTLLLALAGDRLVDPDAEITRLDAATVDRLREAGACDGTLCDLVRASDAKGDGKKDDGKKGASQGATVSGKQLVDAGLAAELGRNADTVGGSGGRSLSPLLLGTAALLLLLLAALVLAVRRSRGPRPVYAVPAARAAAPAAVRTGRAGRTGSGTHRAPDRAAREGARTAVVRTVLHPQGYVELDQCLRRAVWAESGTAPPAPGAPVEVTDGGAGMLHARKHTGSGRNVNSAAPQGH